MCGMGWSGGGYVKVTAGGSIKCPGDGVTGGRKPPDRDAGNRTWILRRSSVCS